MKPFLIFLGSCMLSLSSIAQNPWRNYTTENSALLSNQVGSIIIDHQNNLWIAYNGVGGNGEGISKFDGTSWTHYNTSNSGLPNNDIRAMASDANGNIWFGCYNAGLVKFDGTNWTRFTKANSGIAGDGVTTIQIDQNNNLWIGGYFDGVSKFNGTTWTVYKSSNAPFYPTENCINALTLDNNNNVWVGLGCGEGLAKLNTTTGVWTKYKTTNSGLAHHSVSAVIQDNFGKMWIGYPSAENILTSFDGSTWETSAPFEAVNGGGVSYDGFAKDCSGNLWAGTYRGLYKYDGNNWVKVEVGSSTDKLSGFNQSVAIDRFRGIWWSEQGQGIWTNNELQEYPWFEDIGTTFYSHQEDGGYVKWVNIDTDTDLDLVSCSPSGVHVYENQEGSFVLRSTGLPAISGGFAFGDYDRDGDMDVVIGGLNGSSSNETALYENLGGFQFSLKQSFFPVHNVTASWADIDNDNDLDFILAGADHENAGDLGIAFRIFLYENVNGVFTEVPDAGGIIPCSQCALEWADVNGDGKIDLLASGYSQEATTSALYLNNGDKTFSYDASSPLEIVSNGDAKWGDYDRDGDMDLLLSGFNSAEPGAPGIAASLVYENQSGKLVKRSDINLKGAGDSYAGGTAWADINNDGLLDIIVAGRSGSTLELKFIFELYINDGAGSFVNIPSSLPPLGSSSLDFADYDNDGDLDICFTGIFSGGLKVYRNLLVDVISLPNSQNSLPQPPAFESLTESYDGRNLVLNWGDGYDNTTPIPSISYNYYLRNTSGTIVSPAANLETGYITTSSAQNGWAKKAMLTNIQEGQYFWAVQSVDGGKRGSDFTEEKAVNLIYGPQNMTATILDAGHVKLEWTNYSDIASSNQLERSNKQNEAYMVRASLLPDWTNFVDVNSFILDSAYYYRIAAVTGTGMSQYSYQQLVIPAPPDQVAVEEINFSTLKITWNDNSKYETGYWLERRKFGEVNFSLVAELSPGELSYTDSDLQEYTQYEYRISPRSENGGIYSEIAAGRTNLRPQGVNLQVSLLEDEPYYFLASDFNNSFLDSNEGDVLHHIEIASLPELGKLMFNQIELSPELIIHAEDLALLRFVPDPDVNGETGFTVYYHDGKDNSAEAVFVKIILVPVNDPPSFEVLSSATVDEDFTDLVVPLSYYIPDDETSQIISLTIESNEGQEQIVNATMDTENWIVTFTSIPNKFGMETFTVTALEDAPEGLELKKTISVHVTPVNDPPTLATIEDIETQSGQDVLTGVVIGDIDNSIESLTVSATSSNQSVVKNSGLNFSGTLAGREFTIEPEGAGGESTITVTVSDETAQATQQFKFTVMVVTGIENPTNYVVKVYPNPFAEEITVEPKVPGQFIDLTIYDLSGRVLRTSSQTTGTVKLNLGDIQSGVYLLRIDGKNVKSEVHKIIKKK